MDKRLGVAYFVASCAYTGYFPIAPGTVGSLVALIVDRASRITVPWWVLGLMVLFLSAVGWWAAGVVEEDVHRKDPSLVVVDEVAGMLVALFLLPVSWLGVVVGFLVFRFLDIVKPFPCRQSEKLPGGAGIMADDLIAGLYTNGLLRLASLWWPALLK